MLEIAQAFKEASKKGKGPKRSIIFLHVTGEEKGLLGSAYYADNPIYPLESTVTNLNLDMIGRIDPTRKGDKREYIYIIGSDHDSQDLHNLSEQTNLETVNIDLDYRYNAKDDPNRFYYRSDHYNFAKNGIPIIFYFSGTHPDYHLPSDTPDKIEYYVKRIFQFFMHNMIQFFAFPQSWNGIEMNVPIDYIQVVQSNEIIQVSALKHIINSTNIQNH